MVKFFFFLIIFSFNCLANFPTSWWEKINDPKKPSWEILPQSGVLNKTVILSKRNELGILSNFAATPFKFDGKNYGSVEGAWQSMKFPEGPEDRRYKNDSLPFTRQQVEKMTGFEAKKAGSLASELMKKHHVNYVTYQGKKLIYRTKEKGEHYQLIVRMMKAKLNQNIQVKNILKSTGKLILLPDHITNSNFIPPAWEYNKIWMEIRENL